MTDISVERFDVHHKLGYLSVSVAKPLEFLAFA